MSSRRILPLGVGLGSVIALLVGSALSGCSSSSSGSGCKDFAGTYEGSSDCSGEPDKIATATATQSGCALTVVTGDGETVKGTVSGNVATFTETGGSCTVTVSGGNFTRKCSGTVNGEKVSCEEHGTYTPAESTSDGGGAGGGDGLGGGSAAGGRSSAAGGRSSGTGGRSSGAGGAGVGPGCGPDWSETPECNDCMVSQCCAELSNCGAGTACGALLDCIFDSCPDFDASCIASSCDAELEAGSADMTALGDCNESACAACN